MLNSAFLEAEHGSSGSFRKMFLEEYFYFYILLARNGIDYSLVGNNSAK